MIVVLSAVITMAIAGSAHAAEWKVVKTFGQTWVQTSGIQKASLSPGKSLAGRATIVTGTDGKVFLVRGRDSVIVAPNSVIRLDDALRDEKWTIITQEKGSASYSVNKRNAPHFGVRTPTIAAVVKGTRFKVIENGNLSKVWVSDGVVQVSVHRTGAKVDIKAGQSAVLERRPGSRLNVVGPGIQDPIERSAAVDLPRELTRAVSGTTSAIGSAAEKTVAATTSTAGEMTAAVGDAGGVAGGAASAVDSTASSVGGRVGGALGGLGSRLR